MVLDGGTLAALWLAARLVAGQAAAEGERSSTVQSPTTPAAEGEPDPAAARESDRGSTSGEKAPEATPEPARHPRLGSYELSGEAALGVLFLDVGGNDAQFDEHQNLERGLFLRDLSLTGKRVAGESGPESFSLEAFGLGTPTSHARAETSFAGLDVSARHAHSRFSGTTTSDVHSFDFERESDGLSLIHEAQEGSVRRAGLEFGFVQRDGFTLGTRSVDNRFVSDVPVNQDERWLSGSGQLGLRLGDLQLDLEAGLGELDARDRRSFQAPHPVFSQSQVSEDFAADSDGSAYHGSVRLERSYDAASLAVDAGVAWHAVNADGTLVQHQTGIFNDPDLPFVSDTSGATDFEGRELTADAGLTWNGAGDTELELRFTHELERDDGQLDRTVTLDELMGDPPTVSSFFDDVHHESRLELLEGGLRAPLGEWIDLDLSLWGGLEAIEVRDISDTVVVRRFDDDVDRFGGDGRLEAELTTTHSLVLAGGFGVIPTESSRVGVTFTFDDTRTSFASLAWRWHSRAGTSASSEVRHEQRESAAFGSEGEFDSFSITGRTALDERLSLDASFTYRTFDSRADTTFIISTPGPTQIPGEVSFEGIQRSASAGADWQATAALHPRFGASLCDGSGDGSFDLASLDVAVPYRIAGALEVGTILSWIRFDGDDELSARDYDARTLMLYARASF